MVETKETIKPVNDDEETVTNEGKEVKNDVTGNESDESSNEKGKRLMNVNALA